MFSYFSNRQLRRYLLAFGSFFDSIFVTRDEAGVEKQRILVPLQYGPKEKWLIRITQDPTLDRGVSQIVPRLSYEMTGLAYDGSRKVNTLNQLKFATSELTKLSRTYAGVPYNLTLSLSALVKFQEDGFQIVEQILPFFTPDLTFTIQTIPDIGLKEQIPLTLQSVTHTDNYEGNFETRRIIIWDLTFTMKVFFYGPTKTQARIEEVEVDTYILSDFDGLTGPPTYFVTEDGDLLTQEDSSLLVTEDTPDSYLNTDPVQRITIVPDPLDQDPFGNPITTLTTVEEGSLTKRTRS